ncbi:MAG: sigma-70 family RNA polymerase sigma factor [Nannocystaceae bacterium]|nr:sigma-70 family RNA polymerase sigma factor [Nannocystaceae bacterium]
MREARGMAHALLQALDSPTEKVDADALCEVLEELWSAAQGQWPGVSIDGGMWVAALAERLPSGASIVSGLRALESSDLYLVLGCAQGQRKALAGFGEVLASLRPVLIRAGATDAGVDDLLAQLQARLLVAPQGIAPKVLQFGARARLASWLRVAAIRDFGAQTKAKRPDDAAELEALLVSTADPELEELRMRFREEFRAAFGEALRSLSDRDRVILRHHLIDRLSIDRIGQLYDVHRSTAARWLSSIRDQIHARTQDEFRVRLGLAPADFQSLMALVLSQLSYSIGADLQ